MGEWQCTWQSGILETNGKGQLLQPIIISVTKFSWIPFLKKIFYLSLLLGVISIELDSVCLPFNIK